MSRIFAFADISGFTQITASLIKKSRYGAEQVSDLVNGLFGLIIDTIEKNNGIVLHFAGDAILFTIDAKRMKECSCQFNEQIRHYNNENRTNLSVKTEIFSRPYFPHIIESKKSKILFFSPDKSKIGFAEITKLLNPTYPHEIVDMMINGFKGELRILPIGFINISAENSLQKVKPIIERLAELCETKKIYLNKIEYADKGWMILLGAGIPLVVENAQVQLYELIYELKQLAFIEKIPIKCGLTLQRGFAGIIGNKKRWEFTYLGSNVNLAARIAVNADPYTILCDKSYAESMGEQYEIDERKQYIYKGFKNKCTVCTVKKSNKDNTNIFVGREYEIKRALMHMKNEHASIIVTGEGGIGKTTFVKQLELSMKEPFVRVSGERRELPFSTFKGIRESILPYCKPGTIIKGNDLKTVFFNSIDALREQIVLVIDDAHLRDEESEKLIKWLIYEGNEKIKIIIIQRPIRKIRFHRSKLSKYNNISIGLNGFSISVIEIMFKKYFGAIPDSKTLQHIFGISHGNPLYISQLINYLVKNNMVRVKGNKLHFNIDLENIPYSLRELILMKFDSLKSIEKRFVETGSIIGEEFRTEIPANIEGIKRTDSIIAKALESKLLDKKRNDIVAFYHAIIRETIFDRMLKKDVRDICERIGEYFSKSSIGMDLLQAARFYGLAGNRRATDMFIAAGQKFLYAHQYEYVIHSVKNALRSNPSNLQLENILQLLKCVYEYNIDLETVELAYRAVEKIKFKTNNPEYLLIIGSLFIEIQRNAERARKLKNIYVQIYGNDISSLLLEGEILNAEERTAETRVIYTSLLSKTKNNTEKMKILISFAYLSFILRSDRNDTLYCVNEMKKMVSQIKDEIIIRDYCWFMMTYYLHLNDMKKAAFYAYKADKLAKKTNDAKSIKRLYNVYSIIYGSKAITLKSGRLNRLSIKYAEKLYNSVKREMQMNDMPLITTNLAVQYMKTGNSKKAMKLYYEGLLYGMEINHYIEIPYNKGIIAGLALKRNASELAVKLSKDIFENYTHSDMKAYAGTILYLTENRKKEYKLALKSADLSLKAGHSLPYVFHYSCLFDYYFIHNDIKNMNKWKQNAQRFIAQSRLRPTQKSEIEEKINIVNMLNSKPSKKYIDKYLMRCMEINYYSETGLQYILVLAQNASSQECVSYAKMGLKYAKKLLLPDYIEQFNNLLINSNYNKMYYKKKNQNNRNIINRLNNVSEISDFIDIITSL